MTDNAFFITTPIYYVNDVPHIGHAYTTIACDVLARFKRLDGLDKVFFLTGTDEHGQKVEKSAAAAGVSPQAFCDRVSGRFLDLAKLLNISNDDFIRTTEQRHIESCQAFWRRLNDNGFIYKDKYAGWYAVRDEAFYAESELTTAPDGTRLGPTGAPVEWVEEESYFFRLSKFSEPAFEQNLIAYFNAHPDAIQPASRRNEVMSFIKGGLKDLSISRTTFAWGIPVPGDEKHVMYVWIDALVNYLTAIEEKKNKDALWANVTHIVGKDILRFHCVYWPAFLLAAGITPPKHVFAHGWWTIEGQKMSKSLGNVVDPFQLVEEFGLDAVRYFLLREVPFGNDGDFSKAALVNRVNAELVNGFGNLAQRVLSFIAKNCEGKVFAPAVLTDADRELLILSADLGSQFRTYLGNIDFHECLMSWMRVVNAANKYVDEQAPWALRKTDPARMRDVLSTLYRVIRDLAVTIQPFVPEKAKTLLDQLKIPLEKRSMATLSDPDWFLDMLEQGFTIDTPQGVFPRLELKPSS